MLSDANISRVYLGQETQSVGSIRTVMILTLNPNGACIPAYCSVGVGSFEDSSRTSMYMMDYRQQAPIIISSHSANVCVTLAPCRPLVLVRFSIVKLCYLPVKQLSSVFLVHVKSEWS